MPSRRMERFFTGVLPGAAGDLYQVPAGCHIQVRDISVALGTGGAVVTYVFITDAANNFLGHLDVIDHLVQPINMMRHVDAHQVLVAGEKIRGLAGAGTPVATISGVFYDFT